MTKLLGLAVSQGNFWQKLAAVVQQLPQADAATAMVGLSSLGGLLLFRFDSDLIFPNASYFRSQMKRAIRTTSPPVQQVLIDAESIDFIDTTAMEMLSRLQIELAQQNIKLALARVKDPVRDLTRRSGLEQDIGSGCFYERISDGVEMFVEQNRCS